MPVEGRVANLDLGRQRVLARPSELRPLAAVINDQSAVVEVLQAIPHQAA